MQLFVKNKSFENQIYTIRKLHSLNRKKYIVINSVTLYMLTDGIERKIPSVINDNLHLVNCYTLTKLYFWMTLEAYSTKAIDLACFGLQYTVQGQGLWLWAW